MRLDVNRDQMTGPSPSGDGGATDGRDELEPALLEWYRARITRISSTIGPTLNDGDHEMRVEIETAIARRELPSDASRRWLDGASRPSAGHGHRPVEGVRSDLIRTVRGMTRLVIGRDLHRHGLASEASKTRVLHAVADLQIGGAQQLVVDLAASTRRGFPHHVIARSIGIRVRPRLACTETRGVGSRVRRIFDRHRPEVLHLCHYHAGPKASAWYDLVARVAVERGVPIVQSHCVIGDPWLGTDDQHLVFCSEWSRLRSRLEGIPDSVISPGTPIDFFRAPRRPVRANPVVGMVYRLEGDKIDESSARAIGCLLREVLQARFEVIGDGRFRQRMKRLLGEAGLSGRVTWRGYVPFSKLASIHRSFDLEIAPVVADTFGSGTVHAIASGTPVVGYGIAALPELLRLEPAIATPGSPEEIGRKAAAILQDDALHARIHAAQWAHASSHYALDTMITRYHRLFSEVVRDQATRSA